MNAEQRSIAGQHALCFTSVTLTTAASENGPCLTPILVLRGARGAGKALGVALTVTPRERAGIGVASAALCSDAGPCVAMSTRGGRAVCCRAAAFRVSLLCTFVWVSAPDLAALSSRISCTAVATGGWTRCACCTTVEPDSSSRVLPV